MPSIPLHDDQIRSALASLPGWSLEESAAGSALARTFRFADFPCAMAFMGDCAEDIDRLAHHPEWSNVYDRVSVRLTTHDAGNRLTARDVELAKLLSWKATVAGAITGMIDKP